MVRDPVCQMEIEPRQAAAMMEHHGYGYYFCSPGCQEKFEQQPEAYLDNAPSMRLTVGVMGSADQDQSEQARTRSFALGDVIARRGFILITGACPGLPHECARGVRHGGGWSVGVSPALSLDEHVHKYDSPTDVFDVLIYTGSGLMGREVTNIHSSDMVIIAGGHSGTLGEFAIAYDEGKLIGVLKGTGGITETLPELVEKLDQKDTGARVIYDEDPVKLIARLSEAYLQQHYKRPSCFCDDVPAAAHT